MNVDEWTRLVLSICLLLAIAGCAKESEMSRYGLKDTPSPAESAAPTQPPAVTRSPAHQEILLGTSVQGRPIKMLIFGEPTDTPILIMGAIHGDEPTTADLTAALIELLKNRPDLYSGKRVAVIPVASPDGLVARSRLNANGVDVNRNFPASNYRTTRPAATRPRYGTSAASEPESRAVIKAIGMINPRLLISAHSITNGRQCNNYDGPAQAIAELMSARNGYPAVASIGYPTPGSLGSYAGIDKQIPMITLELPRDQPGDKAWAQNRDALLAAIGAAR